jgi:two-component system, chemotaxis family, chemotaxis protein CheY
MHIVVVEDDHSIREIVTAVLEEEGHEVLQAPDGAIALAVLDRRSPDVILLDMRMPVMDGWTFARAYRQRPGHHAPIVLMTAAHDAAQWAQEIEADAVLPKPFALEELVTVVEQFAR